VEGFSAVLEGREPGEYLAMPDNGYGAKGTSKDFLIRAYHIKPDFKTAEGGSGTIEVRDFIQFSDPDHLIGFPIVREDTGEAIAVVSDRYALVPHSRILDVIEDAVDKRVVFDDSV